MITARLDLPGAAAYRRPVTESPTCALCGKPIDTGEAWMEADDAGARLLAHSGCVYREEPTAAARDRWVPGEGTPGH
jgi:hypothetical protein